MISSLLLAVALAQSPESTAAVPSLVISCKLPNVVRPESRSLEQVIEPHVNYAIQDSGSVRVVSDVNQPGKVRCFSSLTTRDVLGFSCWNAVTSKALAEILVRRPY